MNTKKLDALEKAELVELIDYRQMTTELGFSRRIVKSAINGPREKTPDSIALYGDIASAKQAFRKAGRLGKLKRFSTSQAIAGQWIGLCNTIGELEECRSVVGEIDGLHLEGVYALAMDELLGNAILLVDTYADAYRVWTKCAGSRHDVNSYNKMMEYSTGETLLEIVNDAYISYDGFLETSWCFRPLMKACGVATPEQASVVLKFMSKRPWDGEQNSRPIRLLIAKAAQLYLKK